MSLAAAYGLNYNMPAQGNPANAGIAPDGTPIEYGDDNLLAQELYVKEGATDEYFKKVAALKSFANEVSSRYGYDVTRPNYRDTDSVKYHRSYLEGLAELQATQNRLKRLSTQENLSLQSPNISKGTDEQGNDYFVNTGENDVLKALRSTAQAVKSRGGAKEFSMVLEDTIEQLNEELNAAQSPQERDQLAATIRGAQAIMTDVEMSDSQLAQVDYQNKTLDLNEREFDANQRYRSAQLGLEQQRVDIAGKQSTSPYGSATKNQIMLMEGRIKTLAQLMNPTSTNTMGFTRVDRQSGTYLEKTINGKTESVKIDPKDLKGTFYNLNELLNKTGKGTPVSMDLFNSTNFDLDALSSEMIESIAPVEDTYSTFLEGFDGLATVASKTPAARQSITKALTSSGVKIPANVSAQFNNGVAEDSQVASISDNTGYFGGNPGIKIVLKGKNASDPRRSMILNFEDPEHIAMMKDIFKHNERFIDLPENLSSGTTIAPTKGGVSLDRDKL